MRLILKSVGTVLDTETLLCWPAKIGETDVIVNNDNYEIDTSEAINLYDTEAESEWFKALSPRDKTALRIAAAQNVDSDALDGMESMWFEQHMESFNGDKVRVLEVICNSIERDESQCSEELEPFCWLINQLDS